MKMSGEQVIPAPRARVWAALNDPEVLKQSIPGCQELTKQSPTEFSAKVVAKVGPVKANFAGNVTLRDLNPPESYVISGQGTGGAAGFAKGGATVRLDEQDGKTRLTYDVDAQVGGKLAQIGSRLIDSTAKKMADDFFNRFATIVAAEPVAEEVPATKRAAKKAPAAKKATARKTAAGPRKAAVRKPAKTAAQEPPPVPSLMPEAAIATSAVPPIEAKRRAPGPAPQPSRLPPNAVWWIAGAVIVLVLILLLAT